MYHFKYWSCLILTVVLFWVPAGWVAADEFQYDLLPSQSAYLHGTFYDPTSSYVIQSTFRNSPLWLLYQHMPSPFSGVRTFVPSRSMDAWHIHQKASPANICAGSKLGCAVAHLIGLPYTVQEPLFDSGIIVDTILCLLFLACLWYTSGKEFPSYTKPIEHFMQCLALLYVPLPIAGAFVVLHLVKRHLSSQPSQVTGPLCKVAPSVTPIDEPSAREWRAWYIAAQKDSVKGVARITELKKEVKRLTSELAESKKLLQPPRQEAATRAMLDNLHREHGWQACQSLQDRLGATQRELRSVSEDYESLLDLLDAAEEQKANAIAAASNAQSEAEKARKTAAHAWSEVSRYRKQATAALQQPLELAGKLRITKKALSTTQQQLTEEKSLTEELRDENKSLAQDHRDTISQVADAHEEITDVKKALNKAQDDNKCLRSSMAALKEDNDALHIKTKELDTGSNRCLRQQNRRLSEAIELALERQSAAETLEEEAQSNLDLAMAENELLKDEIAQRDEQQKRLSEAIKPSKVFTTIKLGKKGDAEQRKPIERTLGTKTTPTLDDRAVQTDRARVADSSSQTVDTLAFSPIKSTIQLGSRQDAECPVQIFAAQDVKPDLNFADIGMQTELGLTPEVFVTIKYIFRLHNEIDSLQNFCGWMALHIGKDRLWAVFAKVSQLTFDMKTELPIGSTKWPIYPPPATQTSPHQLAGENSTAASPASEQPVAAETPTAAGDPTAAQEPATETPAAKTPVAKTPAAETPAAEKSTIEKPTTELPAAEQLAIATAEAGKPTVEKPAAEKSITEQSAAEESAPQQPGSDMNAPGKAAPSSVPTKKPSPEETPMEKTTAEKIPETAAPGEAPEEPSAEATSPEKTPSETPAPAENTNAKKTPAETPLPQSTPSSPKLTATSNECTNIADADNTPAEKLDVVSPLHPDGDEAAVLPKAHDPIPPPVNGQPSVPQPSSATPVAPTSQPLLAVTAPVSTIDPQRTSEPVQPPPTTRPAAIQTPAQAVIPTPAPSQPPGTGSSTPDRKTINNPMIQSRRRAKLTPTKLQRSLPLAAAPSSAPTNAANFTPSGIAHITERRADDDDAMADVRSTSQPTMAPAATDILDATMCDGEPSSARTNNDMNLNGAGFNMAQLSGNVAPEDTKNSRLDTDMVDVAASEASTTSPASEPMDIGDDMVNKPTPGTSPMLVDDDRRLMPPPPLPMSSSPRYDTRPLHPAQTQHWGQPLPDAGQRPAGSFTSPPYNPLQASNTTFQGPAGHSITAPAIAPSISSAFGYNPTDMNVPLEAAYLQYLTKRANEAGRPSSSTGLGVSGSSATQTQTVQQQSSFAASLRSTQAPGSQCNPHTPMVRPKLKQKAPPIPRGPPYAPREDDGLTLTVQTTVDGVAREHPPIGNARTNRNWPYPVGLGSDMDYRLDAVREHCKNTGRWPTDELLKLRGGTMKLKYSTFWSRSEFRVKNFMKLSKAYLGVRHSSADIDEMGFDWTEPVEK